MHININPTNGNSSVLNQIDDNQTEQRQFFSRQDLSLVAPEQEMGGLQHAQRKSVALACRSLSIVSKMSVDYQRGGGRYSLEDYV